MSLQATDPLSKEEEARLLPLAKSGDKKAQERVITSVLAPVRRHIRRQMTSWSKEDTEDLEQAAAITILKAINFFDCGRGTRFERYAMVLCSRRVNNLLWDPVRKGRNASTRKNALAGTQSLKLPVVSLDEELESGEALVEVLPNSAPSPDEIVSYMEQAEHIKHTLDGLRERDRQLLQLRYLDGEERTLEAIAKKWGVSRQRVEQLEKRIFRKIRPRLSKVV